MYGDSWKYKNHDDTFKWKMFQLISNLLLYASVHLKIWCPNIVQKATIFNPPTDFLSFISILKNHDDAFFKMAINA